MADDDPDREADAGDECESAGFGNRDLDEEHTLGWQEAEDQTGYRSGSDDRESELGWNNDVGQLALGAASWCDGDSTAPERAGAGFVRCGADDREDDDPAEESDNGIADDDAVADQYPSFRRGVE